MDPKPKPSQPNPAETTLPTKGTSDSQSADTVTNLPQPDRTPKAAPQPAVAAPPATEAPAPESTAAEETPTDPSAADTQPDTHGDTDPGASRNDDAHPL
ncbi:hypothetical protein F0P96_00040 [Hymenobacter busanensis]|uniref:Uncharacterized protein n=1 Tax=Hymenobacter busanensis TaxID=2607656 RepID=A0A7L4ZY67_9BACT|nr:hypothetical protein [Hymenobacter busanensis]KAA9339065.1 hypothetical protein F0P96_00040 [Hymenobacter busanensis]QHJ07172.1 hypothetical protein GUY19_07705 [Hymenobacter busanensis]